MYCSVKILAFSQLSQEDKYSIAFFPFLLVKKGEKQHFFSPILDLALKLFHKRPLK